MGICCFLLGSRLAVRHSLQGTLPCNPVLFAGLPALHPATPFEKGVDPKTFSADKQHPFNERVKNPECRNR